MTRKLWDELKAAGVDTITAMMLLYLVIVVIGLGAFIISGIP